MSQAHNAQADSIRIGLIGASGYTGMELLRLLHGHRRFVLTRATSRAEAGKTLAQLYPSLAKTAQGALVVTAPDMDDIAAHCDLVFLAVPHGTAMEMAGELCARGCKVVDLSADFRIHDKAVYEEWYKVPHTRAELLPKAVYGLPELYADAVKNAQLIANPGCYPTSAILALYPALQTRIIETDGIVIDSKSGTTGAGRKPAVGSLYCEVADSFRAYNLGKHRHTPEIEQELSLLAETPLTVSFNTHLLPLNRGILSTVYTRLTVNKDAAELHALYEAAYANAPWVRVQPLGVLPELKNVRGTMFCDLGIVADPRTKRLIIVSCIDNLCRGASGQALANANLMTGTPMNEGLDMVALVP